MAGTALDDCFAKESTPHSCKMHVYLQHTIANTCLPTEINDGLFVRYITRNRVKQNQYVKENYNYIEIILKLSLIKINFSFVINGLALPLHL